MISTAGALYWIKVRFQHTSLVFFLPTMILLWTFLTMNNPVPHFVCAIAVYFPIVLGIIYIVMESIPWMYSIKIIPYMLPHTSEDHTAVILPHDATRALDGGDIQVLPLLKVLKKYKENFQVYLCLHEEDMVGVLTNPHVKRIWIFGHGRRGGCGLTGKLFSYSDFMTEKTDSGWKLREIEPKEYVYQCHCNPKSTTPLTDYLLKRKGTLFPDADDMPNFVDTGIADLRTYGSCANPVVSLKVGLIKGLGKIFETDLNYMTVFSIKRFIKRYEVHLEKKSRLGVTESNDKS